MGYFEATMHVGITFRVDSSFKLVIFAFIPLPTKILGLHCNTCTRTYLYQLEFWGLIAILALVVTSTN
jgi:hypothetical protein